MVSKRSSNHRPPHSLKRTGAKRNPKLALVIFCEGEKTEPEYLKSLVVEFGNGLVSIRMEAPAGVPKTLVGAAIAQKKGLVKKSKNNRLSSKDQVWAVFDCDEHDDVENCIKQAKAASVNVAFSNPCFELWAYLHLDAHDAPTHRHEMQRMLTSKMPGYDPKRGKTFNHSLLRGKFEIAEKRAIDMCRRRVEEASALGNPYTDMHLLARLIKDNGK